MNQTNDTVGIFYEISPGNIVRTCGFEDKGNTILYYFDDGKGTRRTTNDNFQKWKPRRDLNDFPNARDPVVPYVFDLFYDIKHESQLIRAWNNWTGHSTWDREHFEDLIDEFGYRKLVGERRTTLASLLNEALKTMESMGDYHNCGVLTGKAEEITKKIKDLEL